MSNFASLTCFIPELILSGASIFLLCLAMICSLFKPEKAQKIVKLNLATWITTLALFAALYFVVLQWAMIRPSLFMGMLTLDGPATFFRIVFIATALVIIVFSQRARELPSKTDDAEYYALILGLVVGMSMLAEARNLLVIYLGLEFVGLLSYLLVGYARDSARSSEAALKYVLYGAVASGVFLFGASIYFGLTGTLDVGNPLTVTNGWNSVFIMAGIFMLAGFLFKLAAVPMHAWCPDAYEGAPNPITALLSIAPKAAGFAVLMRVFSNMGVEFSWPIIIAVVSAITMTLGNLVAIPQMNAKRLLAYSSIAHAGYILMGVACGSSDGCQAVYFYFVAYFVMNLGAFLVVQIVSDKTGSDDISTFAGLAHRGTFGVIVSVAMTMFLLSLVGIPPFVGFIGKFYIFSAVIGAKLYWLAIVGIVNTVISLYYYMRIVKVMFFDAPADESTFVWEGISAPSLLVFLSFAVVVLGLAWNPIARIANMIV